MKQIHYWRNQVHDWNCVQKITKIAAICVELWKKRASRHIQDFFSQRKLKKWVKNWKKKTILRPLRIVGKAPCSDGKVDLYLIPIKVLNYLFCRIIDVLPIPEILANQARNQMMLRYKRKETSTTQWISGITSLNMKIFHAFAKLNILGTFPIWTTS